MCIKVDDGISIILKTDVYLLYIKLLILICYVVQNSSFIFIVMYLYTINNESLLLKNKVL